ncbi:MAG: serine/threonine-protein kinase [Eubacterium sp.]|nr:serine/threonine-protein kinase [Eubacterium sp.]
MLNDICLNCFNSTGGFEICPHCGFVKDTPPENDFHLFPGTILDGRYLIGTVIGFGGFGVTYKAYDVKLNSVVAIKEFYPSGIVNRVPGEKEIQIFDGEDKAHYREYLERFLDEAKNLAQFNGRANIVNVFGFFEENNTAYIVMEYLDGISLKDYIAQNGKMPADTALIIINDLLEGVKAVHEKGIVHRDLAPDNIILTNDGLVKILDFGSARFSSDNNEKTLSAFIKPGYAAPEQYASKGNQGGWTDLYGLGATLYYMVTGVKPVDSSDRLAKDTLERPSQMGIDLPVEMDKSIMKAMALQVEMRFKTADEFLAALAGEYEIEYPDVEIKKRKRIRNIIAGLSVAVCVCTALLVVFLIRYFKPDPYSEIEPCDLSVWVYVENSVYDPGKSYMPDEFKAKISENKAAQYENQKQVYVSNIGEKFKEMMTKSYGLNGDINVNVLVFDSLEGLDTSLKDYAERGELPDIFMVGSSYDDIKDSCLVLSDYEDVINSVGNSFLNWENYGELYPDEKLIPLGFSTPIMYVNDSLVEDYKLYMDDLEALEGVSSIDSLTALDEFVGTEVLTRASKGSKSGARLWAVDEAAYNDILRLYGEGLTNASGEAEMGESTETVMSQLKESYDKNGFSKSAPIENYFYFDQLAYFISDTKEYENVNNYMGGRYEIMPVMNNDLCLVSFDSEIAVNAALAEDENKLLAARAFIEYLLSDEGQTYLHIIIGESLPVNPSTLKTYTGANSSLEFLTSYKNAVVLGQNRAADDALGRKYYYGCYVGEAGADELDAGLELDEIKELYAAEETTEATTEAVTEAAAEAAEEAAETETEAVTEGQTAAEAVSQ